MKWLSVDIGIKNMAYCIFTLENGEINVVDWNVINLIESAKPVIYMCSCVNLVKPLKKTQNTNSTNTKPCTKKAMYCKNEHYYCETHAKTHAEYWIPSKHYTLSFLRKKKVGEIIEIYTSLFPENPVLTKPEMIDAIFTYYTTRIFTEIPKPTKKNANDTDLVSIGWAIKREFDRLEHISGVTHVIIENQISPIATRMKTIQGMLAQYFIMKSTTLENTHIHFVSSSNKLKICEPIIEKTTSEDTNKKTSYRKNKQDGIGLCSRYLANNASLTKWDSVLHTSKKDDLADCFLQGIWFMYNQKIITYAENLKINSV